MVPNTDMRVCYRRRLLTHSTFGKVITRFTSGLDRLCFQRKKISKAVLWLFHSAFNASYIFLHFVGLNKVLNPGNWYWEVNSWCTWKLNLLEDAPTVYSIFSVENNTKGLLWMNNASPPTGRDALFISISAFISMLSKEVIPQALASVN